MKTRHGFVSNSSSSSFIVAVPKKGKVCDHCGFDTSSLVSLLSTMGELTQKNDSAFNSHYLSSNSAKDIILSYNDKIKDIKKDKEWCEFIKSNLEKLVNDKDAKKVADEKRRVAAK